ncbi:MAG: ABC transporter permease [Sphingopyxis sp.]|uniref:ABC transporter permease n=1 Tax=Sphingopyxis sp. TaxID=1908224 RepID=UPI002ABA2D41|nr:ABC transporter permease [Sphingopyxis sp.]MDZ3832814.1 ABC transporter permease [Sphingopyxis sp.]
MTDGSTAPATTRERPFITSARREIAFLASSFWDRAMLGLIPLLLLALLSIELSDGVMRDLPIAVVDTDGSAISRELIRRLDAAPGLAVAARTSDMAAAERLIRTRRVYLIVSIPPEAARQVLRGDSSKITLFYNASYSTPSNAALREATAVVQSYAATLIGRETAAIAGPDRVRAPPVAAQTTLLFNPQGSYELQLIGLIHPAILHLVFMVAVVSAIGRELRDRSIGAWLSGPPAADAARICGKMAPYFIIFMLWAVAVTAYLAGVRGWPIAGSPALILAGYAVMYLAYIAVAIMIVGLTRSMAQSLSLTGIYAGASFAFAGAIFPIESASAFARAWSHLLPYTAFAKLWAEQFAMGTPIGFSLRQIGVMLIFLPVGVAIGLPRYIAAARRPELWGKR